ncbi:MAG: DUF5615 family PIN-like protein [Candidatus Omnitrophota bacterium]
MSRLFIELYLDEDIDVLAAELLRSRGFQVLTTQEANQRGASDADQLSYAARHGKAIVTHNRVHFEALAKEYATQGSSHYGIIIAVRRPIHELVRRLLQILNHAAADEMENQIRYI